MKLALEYDVEGNVSLEQDCSVKHNGLTYNFISDDNGNLRNIRIIAPIPDPSQVNSNIGPGDDRVKAVYTFNMPDEVQRQLSGEFQELESILAFNCAGAFRRLNWQNPRRELIPESDEEIERIGVSSFGVIWRFPVVKARIIASDMANVIHQKHRYKNLTIPRSFWREGMNKYRDFEFINAFNSFYLVIEHFYSNGKTRNADILKEYKVSKELRDSVQRCIDDLHREPNHSASIRKLVGSDEFLTVDGMLEQLIALRGRTHHSSQKAKPMMYATPLVHEDYRSMAWVALGISSEALASLQKLPYLVQYRS